MDSFQNAISKIEKMVRTSRLNDLDSMMKVGQAQRISEIGDAISKLDPGGYLIGCGPYTQGIYRLSASETVFGRQATLFEEPVGKVLDFSINDCVTFRPREVDLLPCFRTKLSMICCERKGKKVCRRAGTPRRR